MYFPKATMMLHQNCHQSTVCNKRTNMKIATLNVSTMHQEGKLGSGAMASGKVIYDYCTLIYAGHKKEHKHGVGLLPNKALLSQ